MSEEVLNSRSEIAAVSGSSTSTSNQNIETAEEVEFSPSPALKTSAENASGECMEGHDFTRQKKRIRFSPIVREKQYAVSKAPIDTVSGMEETKLLKDAEERKEHKQNTPNAWNEVFDDRENIPVNTQFEESNASNIYVMKLREITCYLKILQKNSYEERKLLMYRLAIFRIIQYIVCAVLATISINPVKF